jgi:hypothetical protein
MTREENTAIGVLQQLVQQVIDSNQIAHEQIMARLDNFIGNCGVSCPATKPSPYRVVGQGIAGFVIKVVALIGSGAGAALALHHWWS